MREVTRWETEAGTVCNTRYDAERQEALETLEEALSGLDDIYWRETNPRKVAEALHAAGYRLVKPPPEVQDGQV